MKYKMEDTIVSAKKIGNMEVIDCLEGLNSAWMDLDEGIRNLNEVDEIMENIHVSIKCLQTYGDKGVSVLNVDKSLENLIGVPEKMIAVDKAIEGLGEAAKKAWATLKEWAKKIWQAILNLFRIGMPKKIGKCGEKAADEAKAWESSKSTESLNVSPGMEKLNIQMELPEDYRFPPHAMSHIDNLPKCLDSMLKFARESDKLIQRQFEHQDEFIDYAKFVRESVKNLNMGSGSFSFNWSLDNNSGNGHIDISFENVGPGAGQVKSLAEAGIRTAADVKKISVACGLLKKFMEDITALPDVANFMKDEYSYNVNADSRDWVDNKTGEHSMSPKAVIVTHLRFFGLVGKVVNNEFLRPYEKMVSACKYVRENSAR